MLIIIAVDKTGYLLTDELTELLYVNTEDKQEDKQTTKSEEKPEEKEKIKQEPKKKVKTTSEKKPNSKEKKVNENDDYLDIDFPSLDTSDSTIEEDAASLLEDIYK